MIFAIVAVVIAVAVLVGIVIHQSKKEKPGFTTYTGDRIILTTLRKEGNLTLENFLVDNSETLLCEWPINEAEEIKKCKLNGSVIKNVDVVNGEAKERSFYAYEVYLKWDGDNVSAEVYGTNEEGKHEVVFSDIAKNPFHGASL